MKLCIIKPPKRGKMFVTVTATGYMFFSSRAAEEMNLTTGKGLLLARDESGSMYLKATANTDPEAFMIFVRKNGVCRTTCIHIAHLLRRFGSAVDKSTRYDLVEAQDEFYRVEGLELHER